LVVFRAFVAYARREPAYRFEVVLEHVGLCIQYDIESGEIAPVIARENLYF
jgi:hypothetical protein